MALIIVGVVEDPAAAAVHNAEFGELELHVRVVCSDYIRIISALSLHENNVVFDGKVPGGVLISDVGDFLIGLYHLQPGGLVLAEGTLRVVIHIKGGSVAGV